MSKLQKFQNEQGKWSDATFGGQTPDGKLAHLAKEVKELRQEPYDIMEYADCFMLLLDAARKAGISADVLLEAASSKLEVCKKREWGEPNKDGSVEHIR